MKPKNLLLHQNPIIDDLEDLLRQEFENIRFHPPKLEIPDNSERGWDREKTVLSDVIFEFQVVPGRNQAHHGVP